MSTVVAIALGATMLLSGTAYAEEDMGGGADLTGEASSKGDGAENPPEVEAVSAETPSPAPQPLETEDLTVGSPVAQQREPWWAAPLAACESTSRWYVNTGNGYFGGLQMDMTFWRRYGGTAYAARPDLASRSTQIVIAQRGMAVQGPGAWPVCSRRIGLR